MWRWWCKTSSYRVIIISKNFKNWKKKILLKFPERWFEYSFAVGEKWTCVNLPQAVTHDIVERVSDKNTCQKKKSSFLANFRQKKIAESCFSTKFQASNVSQKLFSMKSFSRKKFMKIIFTKKIPENDFTENFWYLLKSLLSHWLPEGTIHISKVHQILHQFMHLAL